MTEADALDQPPERTSLDAQVKEALAKMGFNMNAPVVQSAETVNIDQPRDKIPHVRIVAAVTFIVLGGFMWVTYEVLKMPNADPTVKGSLIGTWATLAIGAAGFWLGSSVGGKLNK